MIKIDNPILAVLVSGNGTNLQSIIDHIQSGKLKAKIGVVISDQPKAFAIERSRKANIPVEIIPRKNFETKQDFENEISKRIDQSRARLIILAGFMRILSREFVQKYRDQILNIHPSLLPDHPGMNAIENAFQAKDSITGVTVHFVDEGVDTGPIIFQEKVTISATETLETLTQKVHALEHQIYPKAIQKVLWGEKK